MSKQIILTQNNTGIGIYNTFINGDKSVRNITGYNCTVDVVFPDGTTKDFQVDITDPINGKVLFILDSSLTNQEGLYKMYFNLSDSNCFITAKDMVTYFVLADKGGA